MERIKIKNHFWPMFDLFQRDSAFVYFWGQDRSKAGLKLGYSLYPTCFLLVHFLDYFNLLFNIKKPKEISEAVQ